MPAQQRGLLLADAHMNVTPNLAAKRDIVHNTIQLAAALGLTAPSVALLAAMDGPAPAFRSTTDAVALKSWRRRACFPAPSSRARSRRTARCRPRRPAQGTQVGNRRPRRRPDRAFDGSALMVMRTLLASYGGLAAGVVLGARMPIVVPTRYDTMEVRMASCVLASLLASAAQAATAAGAARREGAPPADARPSRPDVVAPG